MVYFLLFKSEDLITLKRSQETTLSAGSCFTKLQHMFIGTSMIWQVVNIY